jgi:hypothetical protein
LNIDQGVDDYIAHLDVAQHDCVENAWLARGFQADLAGPLLF